MSAPAALPFDRPESRKARGAFFTPPAIADFLVEWAIRRPADTVYEPSCGEAAFLSAAVVRLRKLGARIVPGQLQGTDIDARSVDIARARMREAGVEASLGVDDFFDVKPSRLCQAVIGNPPYVRYQAFTGASRTKGLEAALAQGIRLTGLASSWAAFVVHAASFVALDGRLALVLPAELLSVNYAAPVRRFLMQRFSTVRLVLFEDRVFPGVLEEVVLLLAEGQGPTTHCELVQSKNISNVSQLQTQTWTPTDSDEKWGAGLIAPEAVSTYSDLVAGPAFSNLTEWGQTSLGMVTGNNKFFTMNAATVRRLGLRASELTKICPPGSRHLRGLGFFDSTWQEMIAAGASGYLFDPRVASPSEAALAYIAQGEELGVDTAYKCRVRLPWWKVPRVPMPDAFFTYMNHDTAQIVANRAGVSCLNSVHGITFKEDRRQIAMDLLPMAALNSGTLLGAELVGRAYGGGVLKLEPKEADRLPLPSLATVRAAEAGLRALRPQLAKGLRQGNLLDVVDAVDLVLRPHLKLHKHAIGKLREARAILFNRRVARGRTRAGDVRT